MNSTIKHADAPIVRTFPGPLVVGGQDGRTLNVQGDLHLHQYNTTNHHTHVHEGGDTAEEVLWGLWVLFLVVVFSLAGIWFDKQNWDGLQGYPVAFCVWMVLWGGIFLTGQIIDRIQKANTEENGD